jgi:uncharacterized protein (DUF1499 family)
MPRPSRAPRPLSPEGHAPPAAVARCSEGSGWRTNGLRATLSLLLALCCVLLAPVPAARAAWLHLEGPVPADLGAGATGLAPCPSPAHCASARWPVEDPQAALAALLPAVLALDGVDQVETEESYLHATVSSRLFGFVDDLELFADGPRQQLQARSQSRLGDSDLGVNGRRLERLHRALLERSSALAVAAPSEGTA